MEINHQFDFDSKYEGPNVYFYDPDHYRFRSITLIRWAVTPLGRQSRTYFQQLRVKAKGKYAKQTRQEMLERAKADLLAGRGTTPYRLRTGYHWGQWVIQHDDSQTHPDGCTCNCCKGE